MNLLGALKCWWYQRHIGVLLTGRAGAKDTILCIRCGQEVE